MAEQNQNKAPQEQDLGQLLKVRREKLANLQEAGKDPFVITKYDQTHHTDERTPGAGGACKVSKN